MDVRTDGHTWVESTRSSVGDDLKTENPPYLGNGWTYRHKILARWRSLTIAATSMQPICAIINFWTDSLEHVGCCTCVVFLILTKFLCNTNHLFMIILPNDYVTIAKLWSVYHHLFSKFFLGSFEIWVQVVAHVHWLMCLMSCVYCRKTLAI